MKEFLKPNVVDAFVGIGTGIVYAIYIASSNETALVLSPIIGILTPIIGKGIYIIYNWTQEREDRGPDGWFGLGHDDHAKSGLSQIDRFEQFGLVTRRRAVKGRKDYVQRHKDSSRKT